MKTANDIIMEVVNQYHISRQLCSEYDTEETRELFWAFRNRTNAIYDTLLAIADYDEELVIDWINA